MFRHRIRCRANKAHSCAPTVKTLVRRQRTLLCADCRHADFMRLSLVNLSCAYLCATWLCASRDTLAPEAACELEMLKCDSLSVRSLQSCGFTAGSARVHFPNGTCALQSCDFASWSCESALRAPPLHVDISNFAAGAAGMSFRLELREQKCCT